MDRHGIDLAIVSLSSPKVFWGGEEVRTETARVANDSQAAGQAVHPDRIRWLASLPWEYPARAGVMVTATVTGRHLVDPLFAPVWQAIDRHGLPVLVHLTAPFGAKEAEFGRERILMPGVGFMFDTTLAIAQLILDGFFDRHPKLKIVAAHGGGYLPYVAGRIDMFFAQETLVEAKIDGPPSRYLDAIWYDSVVYNPGALALCLEVSGPSQVMFGTDLPMTADVDTLYAVVDRLPADQAAAIRAANARRLFGLQRPALRRSFQPTSSLRDRAAVEAIQLGCRRAGTSKLDCFAALAMTAVEMRTRRHIPKRAPAKAGAHEYRTLPGRVP
jgi:aminocarboxymuconate-semialdehyde decarboxylase